MTAARLVEQALSIATLPCVVIVKDRTEANLRWANNALTTNGEVRRRTMTVTATASSRRWHLLRIRHPAGGRS